MNANGSLISFSGRTELTFKSFALFVYPRNFFMYSYYVNSNFTEVNFFEALVRDEEFVSA